MSFNKLLYIFILIVSAKVSAQDQYHRVKIDLKTTDISQIAALGIETDHGKHIPKRSLETDLSQSEINLLHAHGIQSEILINDVVSYYQDIHRPSELDQIKSRSGHCNNEVEQSCQVGAYPIPRNYSGGSMGGYRTYNQMVQALDSMFVLYPDLITQRTPIANIVTHDSNTIDYLVITAATNPTVPKVLYTALHHAREPNSMDQMLFFMWYLLENYETNEDIKKLLDNTSLYFVPCVNPDGYKLNELNQPNGGGLWRKNTYRDTANQLFGVDLNRNYGYFWGYNNLGSSPNPNSQTYRGGSAFSEPETQAIKYLCETNQFALALNYHTFGNLLIHPWGYNDQITDEDLRFKTMGNEMIDENCYLMGTGTETVGYTVNGDSDDWMYGEDSTKHPIYSYTPEVGPSFWPPQTDIIDLNKACIHMNLSTARLSSNYVTIIPAGDNLVFDNSPTTKWEVVWAGLDTTTVYIRLTATVEGIIIYEQSYNLTYQNGVRPTLELPLTLPNTMEDHDKITVDIVIDGINYSDFQSIELQYYTDAFDIALISNAETSVEWTNTVDWGLTSEEVYQGQASLTDSPGRNYRRNTSSYSYLSQALDLSEVREAYLRFHAKWAIEANFDYATIEASTDSVNYTALCGRYTQPGVAEQVLDMPLYDGTQSTWVHEQIDLSDYIGMEKVFIRFGFKSDDFEELDGIYIDSITLWTQPKIVNNTTSEKLASLQVYPNPATNMVYIKGSNRDKLLYKFYSMTGILVGSGVTIEKINIEDIPAGTYILELTQQGHKMHTPLLIIR